MQMTISHITKPDPRQQTALVDLRSRQCRFIVSDGEQGAICCGASTSEGSSWCSYHREVVFIPRHERDRRRAA
jgi:hypothetical protein